MSKINLIFKNICAQFGGKFTETILSAMTLPLLARYFSVDDMGVYFFAFSFVGLFTSFADMGMSPILTREISKDKTRGSAILGNALLVRVFLLLITYFFIFSFANLYPDKKKFIILMSLYLLFYPLTVVNSVFYSELKLHYLAVLNNFNKLLILGGVFAIISLKLGLAYLFWVYIFSHSVVAIAGYFLGSVYVRPKLEFVPETAKYILKESYPIFVVAFMGMFYTKIDTVMLMHFKGEKAVAIYNGALQFYNWFFALLGLLTGILYPMLSRKTGQLKEFMFISRTSIVLFSMMALFISVFFVFFGKFTVLLFLSGKYEDSIGALNYLLPAVFFGFINSVYGLVLIALGRQKELMKISVAVCGLSVLLNLYLIPRFSVTGACLSVVASQMLYFVISNYIFMKRLKINMFGELFPNNLVVKDLLELKKMIFAGISAVKPIDRI